MAAKQIRRISAARVWRRRKSASSDVRMEKVQSVRSAIDAGTYQVSAGDVADKMMQSLLG